MIRTRIVTYSLAAIFNLQTGASLAQSLNAKRPPPKAKAKPAPRYTPPPTPRYAPPTPRYTPPPSQNPIFATPTNDIWSQAEPAPDPYATPHSLGLNAVASFFGSGYGLEYIYLENNWLDWGFALRHTQAKLETEKVSGATEFIEAESNAIRFFARYVQYQWLYVGASFDYIRIEGDYGWEGSAIAQSPLQTTISSQVAALGIFLGSEWEGPWRSFFGVDAAGFATPIFGTVNFEENPDVEVTSRALAGGDIKTRVRDETTAQLNFHYLNLRVGFRF